MAADHGAHTGLAVQRTVAIDVGAPARSESLASLSSEGRASSLGVSDPRMLGGRDDDNPEYLNFACCGMSIVAVAFTLTLVVLAPARVGTSALAGWLYCFGCPIITTLCAYVIAGHSQAHNCCNALVTRCRRPTAMSTEIDVRSVRTATDNVPAPTCAEQGRPQVYPADAPSPQYKVLCREVAGELQALVLAWPERSRTRARLGRRLAKLYGLRVCTGARAGLGVPANTDVEFHRLAQQMKSLLMRYPAAAESMVRGKVEWAPGKAPLRASADVDKALGKALKSWKDTTTSAAESALFSSMGIWVAPNAARIFVVCGIGICGLIAQMLVRGYMGVSPLRVLSIACVAVGCAIAFFIMSAGERRLAQNCWIALMVLGATLGVLECALMICKCGWVYHEHPPNGGLTDSIRDYPLQYLLTRAVFVLSFVPGIALSTHPHLSYEIIFLAIPTVLWGSLFPLFTDYARFHDQVRSIAIPSMFFGLGVFLKRRRMKALNAAKRLTEQDTKMYDEVWARLKERPGVDEELQELRRVWRKVQSGGTPFGRRQRAHTLGELFRQADALNDVLQAKLYDVCAVHGGHLHSCDVKNEKRTLQKVFRSYKGQWQLVNDLCRASVVFETVSGMTKWLLAIGADEELVIVPDQSTLREGSGKMAALVQNSLHRAARALSVTQNPVNRHSRGQGAAREKVVDEKMRLRDDYDAAARTGGYRDVQLTVMLQSEETRRRGVHQHLAEVQLHLKDISDLKSETGHRNYVLRRNLCAQ